MKLSLAMAVRNEEAVLEKCLRSCLDIVDEVVLADDESTDGTVQLAKKLAGDKLRILSVEHNPMFHVTKQKAIDACRGEWILQLDADEVLSEGLKHEIVAKISTADADHATKTDAADGYWMPRLNYFLGRPLRKGGQYPDMTIRLYKNGKGRLLCQSVHEQAEISGTVGYLKNDLLHFPYQDFASFVQKWVRYASLEADEMLRKGVNPSSPKVILYALVMPKVWFLKAYFRHRGYVDGFPGFIFALFSGWRFWIEYICLWEKYHSKRKAS